MIYSYISKLIYIHHCILHISILHFAITFGYSIYKHNQLWQHVSFLPMQIHIHCNYIYLCQPIDQFPFKVYLQHHRHQHNHNIYIYIYIHQLIYIYNYYYLWYTLTHHFFETGFIISLSTTRWIHYYYIILICDLHIAYMLYFF